jgi:hypothetical protein
MVVAIILTAWVCASTVFCLALMGAAANSIPRGDKYNLRQCEIPANLELNPTLEPSCAVR